MVLTVDLVLEELASCPNIPEIHFYGNENTPNWRRKELVYNEMPFWPKRGHQIHFYGNENTPNWCKKELPEQATQRASLLN